AHGCPIWFPAPNSLSGKNRAIVDLDFRTIGQKRRCGLSQHVRKRAAVHRRSVTHQFRCGSLPDPPPRVLDAVLPRPPAPGPGVAPVVLRDELLDTPSLWVVRFACHCDAQPARLAPETPAVADASMVILLSDRVVHR